MNGSNSGNRTLIFSYYLIAGISMLFILLKGKVDSFLILYSFHTDILNVLMRGITFLGDGIFAVLFALSFIFFKFRITVYLLLNWFFSGLLSQILKRFVFSEELRPVAYFKQMQINIYEIPGIEMHAYHSFPSGHTATAFAIFIGLALIVSKTWQKICLLLVAALIGYSRIYLGQHFPADVTAGSVIGIFMAMFIYNIVMKWTAPFLDKPIQRVF